jgi:hypothetical protein
MNKAVHTTVRVFGTCVMFASLFSGCASYVEPGRVPMATVDLNTFQVNCAIKDQQVTMLQSMRQSRDDTFMARLKSMTEPFSWSINHDIAHGNPNKFIDYHLYNLNNFCR